MRSNFLKLKKNNSSKGERVIGEILKRNKIKFYTKWRIGKYEADFIIGRLIIEVDGEVHQHTNTAKDIYFMSLGYTTIHIKASKEIEKNLIGLIHKYE